MRKKRISGTSNKAISQLSFYSFSSSSELNPPIMSLSTMLESLSQSESQEHFIQPVKFHWRSDFSKNKDLLKGKQFDDLGIKFFFRDIVLNKLEVPISSKIIPDSHSPQVILHQGQPIFIKEKQYLSPFFFSSSVHTEKNLENVLSQIKLAHESGVHTFAHLIDLKVDLKNVNEAVAYSGFLIKKTLEICSEANILLRLVFSAPDDWKQKYILSNKLKDPSFCDDNFWKDTENVLSQYIQVMQKTKYYKHIIGFHLERGEWFMPKNTIDASQAAESKFKEWVKIRYENDLATLRAAWFDGKIDFDLVSVPVHEKPHESERFVRTSRRTRKYVDYNLFISDQMVSNIRQLASAVKKITNNNLLVGVSYGYSFEWSHPTNGHLSLGKLLRTKDIDFVTAPSSYKSRKPSQIGAFPCPIDSFSLNGKIFLSEEDFKTPITSQAIEPDEFNPVIKTPLSLEQLHWRSVGAILAHGGGLVWMDTWGNGWLNSSKIWERATKIKEQLQLRIQHVLSPPEVIVFLDERSLACLVDQKAFELLIQNSREATLRSGTQVGFYLLSDLAHRDNFPEAKLYIFLNAWDMQPEIRSAIKNKLHKAGKTLFWLYTAGLFESGREALDHVREVTGLALKPQPFASMSGSHLVQGKHPIAQALNSTDIANTQLFSSSYYALAEQGSTVLAEYVQTGLPSLIIKEFNNMEQENSNWTSVFWGEPILTSELVKTLAQMAGAHIWSHSQDVIHYNHPFLTVHCTDSGPKTIILPSKFSVYQVQTSQWMIENGSQIKFNGIDGHTYAFLIGKKSEIELFLEESKKQLSSFEVPTLSNSIQEDSEIHFDVPIMRLHRWIEDNYYEESKDILLKSFDEDSELELDSTFVYTKQPKSQSKQKPKNSQLSNPKLNVTFRKRT